MKAVKANAWYQDLFKDQQERNAQAAAPISSFLTFTSREQTECQAQGIAEITDEQLEKRIRYQDKVEQSTVPSKDRILTNRTKAAIISLIIKSGRDMMDTFMTAQPIRNKWCFAAMTRLLSEAPRNDEDWLVIRENLLLFAPRRASPPGSSCTHTVLGLLNSSLI